MKGQAAVVHQSTVFEIIASESCMATPSQSQLKAKAVLVCGGVTGKDRSEGGVRAGLLFQVCCGRRVRAAGAPRGTFRKHLQHSQCSFLLSPTATLAADRNAGIKERVLQL